MHETLKNCPFCGGAASLHNDTDSPCWFVGCSNSACPIEPCHYADTEAEAIATWNHRTPQPTQAQVGAVPLDEARRLFDAGWRAAALFCDREDVVADGIIGFGACPQFEAAFSAAHGIKGGQHGTDN